MRGSGVMAIWLLSASVLAQEATPAAVEVVSVAVAAEAAYQTGRARDVRQPVQDEAVFTDITPLTVPEQAIRLPADQQE